MKATESREYIYRVYLYMRINDDGERERELKNLEMPTGPHFLKVVSKMRFDTRHMFDPIFYMQ